MGTNWNTRSSFWTPVNAFSLWWWARADKVAQGGCGSSSLDILKSFLDMVLGFSDAAWAGRLDVMPSEVLPNSTILWFCELSADDLDGLPGFQKPSGWYVDSTMLLNNPPVNIAEQNDYYMKQRISNAESLSKPVDLIPLTHFFFFSYKTTQSLFSIF